MKIGRKITLSTSLLLIIFSISLVLFILVYVSSSFDKMRAMNKSSLINFKVESLQGKVDLAYRIALYHYNNLSIPENERKRRAVEELESLTFDGGAGYFFAYEKRGNDYYFAFNGSNPELTGSKVDLNQLDAAGKTYRMEIIENAGNKDHPVEYYYKKPGTDLILKKFSLSRAMSRWNWIIVSGIYFDDIELKIEEQDKSIQVMMRRIFTGVISIILGVLLLSIIFTRRFSKTIVQPIEDVTNFMKEIGSGQGDLTSRIEIFSDDETGRLSENFNIFVEGIRAIIVDIIETSSELRNEAEKMNELSKVFSDSSREQAAASEEVTSSVEEVTAGIEHIADTADTQSADLTALSSETELISGELSDISSRMAHTDQLAELMSQNSDQGEKSLDEISITIGELNQNSGRMNEIVSIIKDISDKINLLSLNAAIESARAGEAGRGFAVVADEISKLADDTTGSIKNIEGLIKINSDRILSVTGSVSQTTSNFRKIKDEMSELKKLSETVTGIMRDHIVKNENMSSSLKKISGRSSEIKNATNEHLTAMVEITRSSSQINYKTESIAENSSRLEQSAEKIKIFADRLNSKTGLFNV